MAEAERKEIDKIHKLLQSPENYQKFRGLEKSYYEDYMKRKFARK